MEQNDWIIALKNELARNCPDVWGNIQKKIAHKIAAELLRELEGLPSPKGRLFGEIKDTCLQNIRKRGA